MLTGFDADTVKRSLERLHELGAIAWVGNAKDDPKEAADLSADLDEATRAEVLSVFERLDKRSHYELLGVSLEADRKELRKAYYGRAPFFHPDRYFGRHLGPFKAKMEAVFTRLTFAYETLSDPERRAEYDSYLAGQRPTAPMERLGSGATAGIPRPTSEAPTRASGFRSAVLGESAPPLSFNGASQPPSIPPNETSRPSKAPSQMRVSAPPGAAPASVPPRTPEEERARRETLARRLGAARISIPPEIRSSNPPPISDPGTALLDLRRRRAAVTLENQRVQARKYVEAARASASQGDAAAAANAFRLALACDPDNPEVAREHEQATRLAARQLAGAYLRQGDSEARNGNWAAAARSYVRAADGMPGDAKVQEQAANAIVRAGGDQHRAVDFAQRALALAPERVECRLLLAEIHLSAGRLLLARREIDAAREMGVQDDRIKVLLKKMK